MRPGQNKRMRGRPTNNRRGPNPLTRSYESNGPDVKIRGNAHHVAEKYLQLARDAHTGGDPVAAENYLQHAEHYFRLIASAQAAQALAQGGQPRPPGEGEIDDMEEDGDFGTMSDRFTSPAERQIAYQQPQQGFQPQPNVAPTPPQPYAERPPYEGDRQGPNDRAGFANRQDRQGNRFPDRGPRQDRPFADRNEGYRDNRQGRDGRPRDFRPYRDSQSQPARDVSAEGAVQPELPSFITASPRTNAADPATGAPLPDAIASPAPVRAPESAPPEFESPSGEGGAFPPRGRRRRLRSPYGFGGGSSGESGGPDPAPEITDDSPVTE
ncbi:MAG: DUF4167 domain-containing protein [Roseiarcus sp.]|uniref:DUF4167 domain-containing protein n=1 Tax=Roseiarcus sp. TaxID=1969460 RepID=UPI003C4CD973